MVSFCSPPLPTRSSSRVPYDRSGFHPCWNWFKRQGYDPIHPLLQPRSNLYTIRKKSLTYIHIIIYHESVPPCFEVINPPFLCACQFCSRQNRSRKVSIGWCVHECTSLWTSTCFIVTIVSTRASVVLHQHCTRFCSSPIIEIWNLINFQFIDMQKLIKHLLLGC